MGEQRPSGEKKCDDIRASESYKGTLSLLPHTSHISHHYFFLMAGLSESEFEIIQRHPILAGDNTLKSIRRQFNQHARRMGFASSSEAIRCIADGGMMC